MHPLLQLRSWAILTVCLAGALCAFPACSGISVKPARSSGLLRDWQASQVFGDSLSPRTRQTVRQLGLADLYRTQPVAVVERLHKMAVEREDPEVLFALAELCFQLGSSAEQARRTEACSYYYLCAGYAYHYLFPQPRNSTTDPNLLPFDPRFRVACDLYNTGLAKCIRAANRVGRLDPRCTLRVPTASGQDFRLSVVHQGFDWKPEEFGSLLFAADYEVTGLENHHRDYGLGVPLIATRQCLADDPLQRFYPRETSFPVTAFFRFEGTVADLRASRAGRLELINPLRITTVAVANRQVPLESDLTTPLAFFLAHSDLERVAYTGFLRADQVRDRAGVYLHEPYQRGKIPVLMVHGLLSSPLTWAPMFNDLRADPAIRDRFQFWFYLYPTGEPYLTAAADLRQAVRDLREKVDPDHADPALDDMVMVGHSMGGLISRLMTEESGDDFWRLVSRQPLESLKSRPETKAEIQRVFYFHPTRSVRRVVFLGTPHRGSRLSPSPVGRLGAWLVRVPAELMDTAKDLATSNPGTMIPTLLRDPPTSVDLLSPEASALRLLAARPRPEGVTFHSVIGVIPKGKSLLRNLIEGDDGPDGTDGVVPYQSAHLDSAQSELIVPANHFQVHQHPLAVREVRRILLQHWEERQDQFEIQQVSGPAASPGTPGPGPARD